MKIKKPDLTPLARLFPVGWPWGNTLMYGSSVLGLSARHYGAAESAMGAAAILGGVLVSLLAGRMRPRHLSAVFSLVGLCLLAAGGVFLLPLGALGHYLALLVLFCGCQLGCSVFSICAATLIQSRTPAALMGKVMSCVFTLSMCAQPLGQLVYGLLFARLAPPWVLLPSGLLLCAVGALSAGFFRRMDQDVIGS